MPEPLTSKIDNWRIVYSHIYSDIYNACNHFDNTAEQIEAENWAGAAIQLSMASDYLRDVSKHFRYGTPDLYRKMYSAMDWIDDNWPTDNGNGEVTMSAILDAMWNAEPHQCLLFIPMIDAMRGSIQEKTVSTEWMGNALRHFL